MMVSGASFYRAVSRVVVMAWPLPHQALVLLLPPLLPVLLLQLLLPLPLLLPLSLPKLLLLLLLWLRTAHYLLEYPLPLLHPLGHSG